jgi:competence protein ComEC
VKGLLTKFRTVQAFLIFAVIFAALWSFFPIVSYIFITSAFFLSFTPKKAAFIAAVFLLFEFALANTAFVLSIDYFGNRKVLRTTKGAIDYIPANTGDLLVGKFKSERRARLFAGKRYEPAGELKSCRVPVISYLLEKRIRQSAALFYGSGAVIRTTVAHIFAVRSYIDDELKDEYAVTGLYHLLAMSGFHVLIFSGGIFLFFSFLPRRTRVIPALLLLPLLIPLSGFTITVVRAVLFCWAAFFAWFLDLKLSSLRFVAFIAAWLLIIMPANLFSISFLLSFWAVFGIAVLANKKMLPAFAAVMVGVGATVFTLPIQLYFFGVSNILSVITTIIVTPVIWLQMILGIISMVFIDWMIPPLILIERFNAWLMEVMYKISIPFLYVANPSVIILVITSIAAFILCFTKFRYLSAAMLVLPLLPIYPSNIIIFPDLPPSQKGYVLKTPEGSEIFFQGMRSSFVRTMLPVAAKLGIRKFDYGNIRIFDGKNLYLKIKDTDNRTGVVCVNSDDGCPYVYFTRSNTLKPPLRDGTVNYIIYKNKAADDRIILLSETGELSIKPDKPRR